MSEYGIYKFIRCFIVLLCIFSFTTINAFPQEDADTISVKTPKQMVLVEAVMCEEIKELSPRNPAIVFPVSLGKISCFSTFDSVPQKTVIYHNWYFKDTLSTSIKLSIQPPRWSTFSRIQLREADKGPWRLDILDEKKQVIRTLRFSIVD